MYQAKAKKRTLEIEENCRNIIYFILKTNSAWALFPVLLAVLHRSGHDVGNINHTRYACEKMSFFLNQELILETKKWFKGQKSVTVTADIGTIMGLSMLVVLLESDFDSVKLVCIIDLITCKNGDYLADQIFHMFKSKEFLNLTDSELQSKVSGMAGDGAFCKENKPFKNKMRALFGSDFKFRWDMLHLVNRAHDEAIDSHPEIKRLLEFVQCHSSAMRSGLDYTSLFVSDLVGFRRPKIKSNTRMVNYEFDQLDVFLSNSKYFDHPQDKIVTASFYIILSLSTKLLLQEAQKTSYSSDFIKSMFLDEGGKQIMTSILEILKS